MSYINNPGFDFETTEQYTVWITASASGVASNPYNLSIDINNIAEPPVVSHSHCQSHANVSEDISDGSLVYQVCYM